MDWQVSRLSAFWTAEDEYVVRAESEAGVQWFRIEAESMANAGDQLAAEEARRVLGALLADIIPMGGSRVAFPVGSTGRRTYRVWRSNGRADGAGRTRILGVRAARSRRLPA
ncbi:hypothetical protein GAU_1358 [Gemmatimonas aurantiaca T-27]|uniref:Uncharacterized protein n=1 Tax=Gemmatimonas aurantiaca (strain DSM 14586 / JCM 11422 / NBRC 100505 / T-27) TaxID=379066 RepID=C1A840_GEMAT|nr:hypothetical protein GAU_1358 [Gemmatimonas aurantiaca T-27]